MIRRFLVRGFLFRGVAGAAMVGLGWDERIIRMVRTGQATAKAGPVIEKDLSQAGYSRQQVAELIRLIPLGIITHPVQAGGQPDYQGLPQPDSDADGLPDSW